MAVKKIQSIQRGLRVLECLNRNNGLSCAEIAKATNLARGTVYRLLLTLDDQGYVYKNVANGQYLLTHRVMGLSHGFDLENWPTEAAKPIINRLCQDVHWPIGLSTLCGTSVIVRENTDSQSALVFEYIKGGYAMPLLASASGWVLFAFSGEQVRDALLGALMRYPDEHENPLNSSVDQMKERAILIREQGYAHFARPGIRTTTLSVPIFRENKTILAALSLRFFTNAIEHKSAVEKFAPLLKSTAKEIAISYGQWVKENTVLEKVE